MTPTWVMADDGLLRRDPVIRGVDRDTGAPYFLCFDDNEPPELVISTYGRLAGDEQVRREAEAILDRLGVSALVGSEVMRSVRCFGDDAASGPYRRAAAVWLDILQPLPADILPGKGVPQPRGGDCVVYSFGQAWG